MIENNLNAIARTPVMHRSELLKHVFPPTLKRVIYVSSTDYEIIDPALLMDQGIDNDVVGPEEAIVSLEISSTSSSESPYISEDSSDGEGDSKTGFELPSTSDKFEGIDPRTGEPYGDYEVIDPITGEPIPPGAHSRTGPDLPYIAGSYERIDPLTGEACTSLPGYDINSVKRSSTPPVSRIPRIPSNSAAQASSPSFDALYNAYISMDILEDPYILSLQNSDSPDEDRIEKLIATKGTYSQLQVKGLVSKAAHIRKEYGLWATEWYIKEALRRTFKGTDDDGEALMEWNGNEKRYLKEILKDVPTPAELGPIEEGLTNKVERLIEALLEEYHGQEEETFAGLVFVEQRVEVSILQQILKKDKRTKDIFRSGTIVGGAQGSAKVGKGIYELVTPKNQVGVIEGFRSGALNLLISTSVVEEGLDIPACHLVVCFSLPPNLKSFIQRRGRARREKSTYILMFEEGDREGSVENFERREKEMVEEYLDANRELVIETEEKEESGSDDEGVMGGGRKRRFVIESTG